MSTVTHTAAGIIISTTMVIPEGTEHLRIRLAGNGTGAYLMSNAHLEQGTFSIPITVSGSASNTFYIPKTGIWSDWVFIKGIVGPVYFIYTVFGEVSVGEYAEGVDYVEPADRICIPIDSVEGNQLLILNFEGEDGAVSWEEEAHNTPIVFGPDYEDINGAVGYRSLCELDTSLKKFGDSSLLMAENPDPAHEGGYSPFDFSYTSPLRITGDFTAHGWLCLEGISHVISENQGGGIHFAFQDSIDNLYDGYAELELFAYFLPGYEAMQVWFYGKPNNHNTTLVGKQVGSDLFPEGQFVHFAIIGWGRKLMLAIDGKIIYTATAPLDNPWAGFDTLLMKYIGTPPFDTHFDAIEIVDFARWNYAFTPPTMPPGLFSTVPTTDIFSEGVITVTDYTLIVAGDTLTITQERETHVYTFVTALTGADNEILLSSSAVGTAENIATAISATFGSEFACEVLLPAYTTDLCTGGTASASSARTTHVAANAFDVSASSDWEALNAAPGWIKYDLGAGNSQVICMYTVTCAYASTYSFEDWVFQGSTDNAAWVDLDSQVGQLPNPLKEYIFVNFTPYRYYRWYVTKGGATKIDTTNLEIMSVLPPDVKIIKHSDEVTTITTDTPGLTVPEGELPITIIVRNGTSNTIPNFRSSGEGTMWPFFGDNYGLASLPSFIGEGSGVQNGVVGVSYIPSLRGYAHGGFAGNTSLPKFTGDGVATAHGNVGVAFLPAIIGAAQGTNNGNIGIASLPVFLGDAHGIAYSNIIKQYGFKFRNDNGSEVAATPKAAQNEDISLIPQSKFRVRVGLDIQGDPPIEKFQLECRIKKEGELIFSDWVKVN